MTNAARILVIKLGALGDFVQAMGPAAAIRAHHADAQITLLTIGALCRACRGPRPISTASGSTSGRPSFIRSALWRLRRRCARATSTRVYDLQTSDRSSFYFQLMGPAAPEWSGIAQGRIASRMPIRARDVMHTIDRQAEQLRHAGIARCAAARSSPGPRRHRALSPAGPLRPAGAGRRRCTGREALAGRANYAALARLIAARGVTPVVHRRRGRGPARRGNFGRARGGRARPHRQDRVSATSSALGGGARPRRRQRYRPDASRRRRRRSGDRALFRRVGPRA